MRRKSSWLSVVAAAALSGAVYISAAQVEGQEPLQSIGPGEGFVDIVAWPGYIERGEIKPLLARTFPLEALGEAQRAFGEKKHVGNFVILPGA